MRRFLGNSVIKEVFRNNLDETKAAYEPNNNKRKDELTDVQIVYIKQLYKMEVDALRAIAFP